MDPGGICDPLKKILQDFHAPVRVPGSLQISKKTFYSISQSLCLCPEIFPAPFKHKPKRN
jgi:hypothetical protein